jgi:hypothetical protein
MRRLTDAARLRAFMRALGREATAAGRVYLTGGACAVLLDWRPATIDIDLELGPTLEPLLRVIPALKESLQVNVELASPGHFIPELPGWQDRSLFIVREGPVDFHHYDFYAQALSKIERGHARDLEDVRQMVARGLVAPARVLAFFEEIAPELFRYPAIDPPSFRRAVEHAVATLVADRRD